jgi:hypothetical protein
VVVHEAHGLHEREHRGGPDEAPAAPLEVLRERDRRGRGGGALGRPEVPGRGFEAPDVRRERPLGVDQLDGAGRVADDRLDLSPVPHDPRVAEEALDVALVERRDRLDVEPRERGAEVLPLGQDRAPAQTGLEALQAELLEQPAVVVDGKPPLGVVVAEELGRGAGPTAARPSVRGDEGFHSSSSVGDGDVPIRAVDAR